MRGRSPEVEMLRIAVLGLAMALALTWSGSAVRADQGVALDVGTVRVGNDLSRGGRYSLPPLGVSNPGDETTTYEMGIDFIENQSGRRPSDGWFSFEPARFSVEPGATVRVRIQLDVPPGARPADYEALVVASIVTEDEGTALGGAAAARLDFTIKPSNWFEAWLLRARYWLTDNAPWSYLLPSALGVFLVFWLVRRRFSFSIERRV
jgi:hypothetical protein